MSVGGLVTAHRVSLQTEVHLGVPVEILRDVSDLEEEDELIGGAVVKENLLAA